MAHWYEDNSQSIGHTPLVRFNRVIDGAPATVLGKVEGRNPAYSVKCSIGAAMVWDAEKRGLLGPGKELVEPTSGNTGIALAFVAVICIRSRSSREIKVQSLAQFAAKDSGTDRVHFADPRQRSDKSRRQGCAGAQSGFSFRVSTQATTGPSLSTGKSIRNDNAALAVSRALSARCGNLPHKRHGAQLVTGGHRSPIAPLDSDWSSLRRRRRRDGVDRREESK